MMWELGEGYKLVGERGCEGRGRIRKYGGGDYLGKGELLGGCEIKEEWKRDYVGDELEGVIS